MNFGGDRVLCSLIARIKGCSFRLQSFPSALILEKFMFGIDLDVMNAELTLDSRFLEIVSLYY